MNLEPAPRIKKSVFAIVTAVSLLIVLLIGKFAPDKFAVLPFTTALFFLFVSITAFMSPFLIDYAADSAEYVQQERLRLNEQIQRLQAAGENLARAAAQIKAVEEAVHKAAHSAENLPYRMQEKLAEFNETLAEKENADREALEEELSELRAANSGQLKAVADQIAKTTSELAALELSTRRQLSAAEANAAEANAAKVQQAAIEAAATLETQLSRALTALDTRLTALARAPVTISPVVVAPPAPANDEPLVLAEASIATPAQDPVIETAPTLVLEEPTAIAEETTPKKPRAARKSKPEDTFAATREPAETTSEPTTEVSATNPTDDATPRSGEEPTEFAASSDGATRLLATAYIGIGNKLFIRGEGPGLSWDKGVPMQFVSIGKWGWATHDASGPVRCALFKNDETAAMTGEVTLEPGKHVEITALF